MRCVWDSRNGRRIILNWNNWISGNFDTREGGGRSIRISIISSFIFFDIFFSFQIFDLFVYTIHCWIFIIGLLNRILDLIIYNFDIRSLNLRPSILLIHICIHSQFVWFTHSIYSLSWTLSCCQNRHLNILTRKKIKTNKGVEISTTRNPKWPSEL